MDAAHVRTIDQNFSLLLRELQLTPQFYSLLENNSVFSHDEVDKIKRETTSARRKARVLTLLREQGPVVVDRFCTVLQHTDQPALERLLQVRHSGGEGGTGEVNRLVITHDDDTRSLTSSEADSPVLEPETQRLPSRKRAKKLREFLGEGPSAGDGTLGQRFKLAGNMSRSRAQNLEKVLLRERVRDLQKHLAKDLKMKERRLAAVDQSMTIRDQETKIQTLEAENNKLKYEQQSWYVARDNSARDRQLSSIKISSLERDVQNLAHERDLMKRQRDQAVRAEWLANTEKDKLARARDEILDRERDSDKLISERNEALATIARLQHEIRHLSGELERRNGRPRTFEMEQTKTELQNALLERDRVLQQQSAVVSELDSMLRERDDAVKERDEAFAAMERALEDIRRANQEKDSAQNELLQAIREKEATARERDHVSQQVFTIDVKLKLKSNTLRDRISFATNPLASLKMNDQQRCFRSKVTRSLFRPPSLHCLSCMESNVLLCWSLILATYHVVYKSSSHKNSHKTSYARSPFTLFGYRP
ncbi:uncharacterized protein LOC144916822 [Branchiostoma floridae x Branchiostoma belcheri]